MKTIILSILGLFFIIGSTIAGLSKESAYKDNEQAYYICLQDLPHEECINILGD